MLAAAKVRATLAASRARGLPFEDAWYSALRQLIPPPGCPPEVAAEHKADKALWREMKPHWRAAYERRRDVEAQGLVDGLAHAHRRLADMLLADGELEREVAEELGRVEQAKGRQRAAA